MDNVKIHGLMRTGTNFLEFLVRKNFEIEPLINQHAWKHGKINESLEADTLIIYKNIYSWLVSIYNYAITTKFFKVSKNISLTEFIRKKFIFKEYKAKIKEDNPIVFYNKTYKSWLEAKIAKKKIFIDYEKLLSNTDGQIKKLSLILGLSLKKHNVIYPKENILPHECKKVKESDELSYKKKNYYKNKEYMNLFSQEDVEFITEIFDKDTFEKIKKMSL